MLTAKRTFQEVVVVVVKNSCLEAEEHSISSLNTRLVSFHSIVKRGRFL